MSTSSPPCTSEQQESIRLLSHALQHATDSGFFDSALAWDCIHPDTINQFCEGVEQASTFVKDNS